MRKYVIMIGLYWNYKKLVIKYYTNVFKAGDSSVCFKITTWNKYNFFFCFVLLLQKPFLMRDIDLYFLGYKQKPRMRWEEIGSMKYGRGWISVVLPGSVPTSSGWKAFFLSQARPVNQLGITWLAGGGLPSKVLYQAALRACINSSRPLYLHARLLLWPRNFPHP